MVLAIGLAVVVAGEASPTAGVILALSFLVSLLGLIDDLRGLPAGFRLVCQLLIASIAVLHTFAGSFDAVGVPSGMARTLVSLLAVVWITSLMNAFNFMDGIDGLAAAQAIICGATIGLVALSQGDRISATFAFAAAAAALGFLPWNLRGGSVFLGDAGSLTFGFLFGLLVVRSSSSGLVSVAACAMSLLPFLLDTGVTLARRAVRHEPLFRAHRTHYYQRLVALGWSHASVTGVWSGLALMSAVVGLSFTRLSLSGRITAASVLVLVHVAVGVLITVTEGRSETGSKS